MRRLISLWVFALFLSGCATPAYKQVFREKPVYNSKEYSFAPENVYRAVVKVLCSRNFIIEEEDEERGFILAKRSFQRGKRTTVLAVQAKITSHDEDVSTLYLNAVETTERLYVADRTRFFLFIIPLPGGGGKQADKIKEGEKIIKDKEFYQNFFSSIDEEIKPPEVTAGLEKEPQQDTPGGTPDVLAPEEYNL